MAWAEHWERSERLLVWAFGLATLPNAIDAFTDPDAGLWDAFRFVPSTVFAIVFVEMVTEPTLRSSDCSSTRSASACPTQRS
jgi:hypothetical protein